MGIPSQVRNPHHTQGSSRETQPRHLTFADLTNNTVDLKELAELKTQNELADAWKELVPSFPAEMIHVLASVQHAVQVIHALRSAGDAEVDVLVAGSLHLVGGVIEAAGLGDVALAL